MSYFNDQQDAWFDNNCIGNPEDYTPVFQAQKQQSSILPHLKPSKSQKQRIKHLKEKQNEARTQA